VSPTGTTVSEERREIPVAGKYDVIVAGGGSGGAPAAVAAARSGARTLLIDRNAYLGGTATGGMMAVFWTPSNTFSGYMAEVLDELLCRHAAQTGAVVPFDPQVLKEIFLDDLLEAGADVLLYTWVVDAIVEDGVIRGVIVENKSGRQAILGDVVVDATADGDVAAAAGARFQKGRADGAMRPVTVLFRLGNVDIPKLVGYAEANPDQFIRDTHVNFTDPAEGKLRLAGFFDLVKRAREAGELDKECHYLRVEYADFERKMVLINTVRVYGIDGTDGWQLTRGEIECRRQMARLIAFMKRDIPGFANAFLVDSSTNLGVRETRHVIGEYVLDYDDVLTSRQFDDVVATNSSHLPHGKEMHSPDANEGGETDEANRYDEWPLLTHEIPLRSLVVKDVKNLLVAGRCISATHEADRMTRNIPPCVMTGQVAGTAAALAARVGRFVSALDVRAVQAALVAQGVNLGRPIPGLEPAAATRR
jgi:hypothetical protein